MPTPLEGALAIGLAWAGFGTIHSLLTRVLPKLAAERLLGPAFLAGGYRAIYVLISLVTAGWLWLLPGRLPGDILLFSLPESLWSLPYLVKAAAAGLGILVFRQLDFFEFLGAAQLLRWRRGELDRLPVTSPGDFPMTQAPDPVACGGTYLWVRHPLNTGAILWIWAQPAYTLYNTVFALGLTLYVAVGIILEERDLIHRYGASYARYQAVVPAFIGGFSGLRARKKVLEQP